MYDNGQIQFLEQFKDGKPHGLQTYWHENGQKELEATYKDGKTDGQGKHTYRNGDKYTGAWIADGRTGRGRTLVYGFIIHVNRSMVFLTAGPLQLLQPLEPLQHKVTNTVAPVTHATCAPTPQSTYNNKSV